MCTFLVCFLGITAWVASAVRWPKDEIPVKIAFWCEMLCYTVQWFEVTPH